MTVTYARVKPRGRCPHALCGRGDRACRKLAAGNACLKTHFATFHDWKEFMYSRLDYLDRIAEALGELSVDEDWNLDALFHSFSRRIDDRHAEAAAAGNYPATPERSPEGS